MQWRMVLKRLLLILSLYSGAIFAEDAIPLTNIRLQEHDQQLLITLLFDDTINYHCMLLEDPKRLVLDLNKVSLKTELTHLKHDLFKQVRSSDHQHEYLRLVFDLNQKTKFQSSFSATNHALTLKLTKAEIKGTLEDLSVKKQDDFQEENGKGLAMLLKEETQSPKPVIKLIRDKHRKIVVVIDPGHGGKDPGAIGLHGAVEKEVVLKIAKQLQAMLNKEPGFSAILTRSTDYYLPLRQRLAIARKNHADMFIAVHADAYNHCHATGASVYALSERGATSEAARWLAEKENESELGGLSDELADKDAILRSVLIDLSQTHTIESSLQIGNTLLTNLGKFAKLHHPRVEQAAFVVLKSPDIPSVLVETGFLSNPSEEEKLIDSVYQHQTALSLKEGIVQYFTQNPAAGSWFVAKFQKKSEVAINEKPVKGHKRHT
jgi:N-acetylmuramoyl-L-alanine amidase